MKSCKKVNWKTDIWCYFNKPSATKTVNFPACETLKSQFGSKDFSIGRPRSLRSKCSWELVRFGNVILAQYRISNRPTIEALASCRYRKSRIRSLSSFCEMKEKFFNFWHFLACFVLSNHFFRWGHKITCQHNSFACYHKRRRNTRSASPFETYTQSFFVNDVGKLQG